MDTKELNKIASTYEESMLTQGLSHAELVMLLALVEARVRKAMLEGHEMPPHIIVQEEKPVVEKAVIPPRKKGVTYDPVYDPPPPMSADPLPPAATAPSGKVIAKQGQACLCDSCTRLVYTVNKNVPDNCKVDNFIDSFTPYTKDIEPIGFKTEIRNIDGNISIDCPACGAAKSLYLVGKKSQ